MLAVETAPVLSHFTPVVVLYPAVEVHPAGKTTTATPMSHLTPVVELYPAVEEQPAGKAPVPVPVPVPVANIVFNLALVAEPTKPVPDVNPKTDKISEAYLFWNLITAALVAGPK